MAQVPEPQVVEAVTQVVRPVVEYVGKEARVKRASSEGKWMSNCHFH